MPGTVALYARVSTSDQDASRQLDELRAYARDHYPDHDIAEYVDIVSGAAREGRDEYDRLCDGVEVDTIDVVLVDEISRLSRLGAGEIHNFIQLCAEHATSVEDREVGLELDVTDSAVDQAVTRMVAGLMGSLAEIEHKQKLRRIRSGIEAAQDAGKWTGRPPRGFTVDDGYLRVDPEPFLRTRATVERVAAGEGVNTVAGDTGIPSSRSPHHIRTGTITWLLNIGWDRKDVAERVNATTKTIETHYDKADPEARWRRQRDRMERRRRSLVDGLDLEHDR